jgi:hypothetical protein
MLGNYSRRLHDYSRIRWSTIQPRDASSTLEDFWLVVRGLVVWTSLGPLPRWVSGPTTRWAPRTTRLEPHGT